MKYTFALLMVLMMTTVFLTAGPARAQDRVNRVEMRQDSRQLPQDRHAMRDDARDLGQLQELNRQYREACSRADEGAIGRLEDRFLDWLGGEAQEGRKELRQAKREVRQSRKEVGSDRREVRENRREGASLAARRDDRRDLRDDRRDLRDDRRDLKAERREAGNLKSVRDSFVALAGRTDAPALERKQALLARAVELARAEGKRNSAERREDRREKGEDRRERREDRRQR